MRISITFDCVPLTNDYIESILSTTNLTNLHWQSTSRTIRTIQSLPIQFIPLSSSSTSTTLADRPFAHLLFVICDDNDAYRATIRTLIREWLDQILLLPNQEWIIIHSTQSSSTSASASLLGTKFYQRKGTVLDKIKADFNTGKRDRCVQITLQPPSVVQNVQDPTVWADFNAKVKEAIIATFDTKIALYEEDVRKAASQRQLPGWSFCTFFTQKEALADCFESMNLYGDALVQYDELEASFFQAMKENNLTEFTNFGGRSPGDDNLTILSTTSKPYREQIASSTIAIFDFRIYLFARQATLLLQMGKIAELAKRAAYFISTFTRTLREHQASLGLHFLESWTYSSCLHIVGECESWFKERSSGMTEGFTAVKAELLELARKQLDKIGIASKHLPATHPFSMSLNEIVPGHSHSHSLSTSSSGVSRPDLISAIAEQTTFDQLYIDLTNRAIQAYKYSRRNRCALKLDASLAALEEHRHHYPSAQKLFIKFPPHYVDHRWTRIEAFLLHRSKTLQTRLGMEREGLLSNLALVRAGIEFGSRTWRLHSVRRSADSGEAAEEEGEEEGEGEGQEGEQEENAGKLMSEVRRLAGTLTKDFAALSFPTFSIRMASDRGAIDVIRDGVTVVVTIRNLLPCTVEVEEVRLKFLTSADEQVWFTSKACSLVAGETTITLFSPTAVIGSLALQLSQIRYSRIIFQYSYRPLSERNLAPDLRLMPQKGEEQPLVHFPRDLETVEVGLELPKLIRLDEERQAIICIETGRNQLVSIQIQLFPQLEGASFDFARAILVTSLNEGGVRLVESQDRIMLENLGAGLKIKIQIPLLEVPLATSLEVQIVAEYYTTSRPTIRRNFRRSIIYPVALPLSVTVQDFFRSDFLLSKFSLTTTTDGNAIRVRKVRLEGNERVVVKACKKEVQGRVTIQAGETANFLFKISRTTTESIERPLELELQYRTIRSEFLSVLSKSITTALQSTTIESSLPWFLLYLLPVLETQTDMKTYAINRKLNHLVFDSSEWSGVVEEQFRDEGERREAMRVVEGVYEGLKDGMIEEEEGEGEEGEWSRLMIPVELPSLNILALVQFTTTSMSVEVGQPIQATLSIRPNFSWASSSSYSCPAVVDPITLIYDVTTNDTDWIISGRKKGEFLAKHDDEYSIQLVLIPLRSGHLFLPSIIVRPLVPSSSFSFSSAPLSPAQQESLPVISCETSNLKAAVTVEVLPLVDVKSTFSIRSDRGSGLIFAL